MFMIRKILNTPIRMTIMKKKDNKTCSWECGQSVYPYVTCGNVRRYTILDNTLDKSLSDS